MSAPDEPGSGGQGAAKATAKDEAAPVERWIDYLDRLARFQASYLGRVAKYADDVGYLASRRITDPGDWVSAYTTFLSRLADDWGDWVLKRDEPFMPEADGVVPLYTTKMKAADGTASIKLRLLPDVFEAGGETEDSVTLVTQGFRHRLGGEEIRKDSLLFLRTPARERESGAERAGRLKTEKIPRSDPYAHLNIFNAKNVALGDYIGMVWAEETARPVAVIEVEVS